MHAIISVIAAMLLGTAIGSLFSPRQSLPFVGYLLTIVLAVLTIITPSWTLLAIVAVVLLAAQFFQRDARPARA